jgi:hypothetical protein
MRSTKAFCPSGPQPVAGRDLAAILRECDRDGVTDAARGTGHDHALSFERDQHASSLRMMR